MKFKNKYAYNFIEKIIFPSVNFNKTKLKQRINGKTILITGASYGIGESIAHKLAIDNVTIILIARTEDKLLKLKNILEQKGAKVFVFKSDLYIPQNVEQIIAFLNNENLKPNIFINNAGKSIKRSIFDSLDRYRDFEKTMSINYFSPVKIILNLIPCLVKQKGQIINISSVNVLLKPIHNWAAYSASKKAFDVWLKSITPELYSKGSFVSTIYLPLVRTRMILPTKAYDKMPAMNPEHVADIICKIIINRKRKHLPWWTIFAQIGSVFFGKKIGNYN